MTDVLLASKSPRRQELLRNLIDPFIVLTADIDESVLPNELPADFVLRLAKEKALRIGETMDRDPDQDMIVIGADTIVVDGNEILGKPNDEEDARRILEQLRGKRHQVFSGIVIYTLQDGKISDRLIETEVVMRDYRDDEIQAYIDSGDPFDKAGAYAIQNKAFDPAPVFDGCYANVMGLPLCDLYVLMKSAGLVVNDLVAENCQNSIQYQCPVFKKRLSSVLE